MRNWLIALTAAAGLAACDAGPKATSSKPVPPTAAQSQAAPETVYEASTAPDRKAEPVRLVAGKPVWSSNRRYTAEDNARSHFERDGADFQAKTVDDFVAKAHAFTAHPPKGTRTLKRPNGDVLFYHEASNTFAVISREGAPRTMFKPRNGASYWSEQVRKETARGATQNAD